MLQLYWICACGERGKLDYDETLPASFEAIAERIANQHAPASIPVEVGGRTAAEAFKFGNVVKRAPRGSEFNFAVVFGPGAELGLEGGTVIVEFEPLRGVPWILLSHI